MGKKKQAEELPLGLPPSGPRWKISDSEKMWGRYWIPIIREQLNEEKNGKD